MACSHPECKELAEKLWIEPETDCNGSCNLKDKDKLCKNCKPLSIEYVEFKNSCPNKPEPILPCFQEPENFVKLLETFLASTFGRIVFGTSNPVTELTNKLIKFLTKNIDLDNFEMLKQQVKQVNWRY